jgi:uncharacterized coiled-coil protein SlyX
MERRITDLEGRVARIESVQNTLQEKILANKEAIHLVRVDVGVLKQEVDKMSIEQTKFHEKMNDFMMSLPKALESSAEKIIKTMDERMSVQLTECRSQQRTYNASTFLQLPPGFLGNFLRLFVYLIAAYGGYEGILRLFLPK